MKQMCKTRSTLAAITLFTVFVSVVTGCSMINAPDLSGPDTTDASDTHDTHDTSETPDISETPDVSPPKPCLSNADCNTQEQFCDTTSEKVCKNFPQLALAGQHSCAILPNGDVNCWGNNDRGQLGIGKKQNTIELTPVRVPLNKPARLISAGSSHTCVVLTSDEIYCWGHTVPADKSSGNTDTVPVTSPTQITQIHDQPDDPIIQIVSGALHSCVLHQQGNIYCWGNNSYGQLSINTTEDTNTTTMHKALMPLGSYQIAAASFQTCALSTKNDVYCWGNNTRGYLGIVDSDSLIQEKITTPTLVPGTSGASSIAMGQEHTCAITAGHDLKCWGNNTYGQLGAAKSGLLLPTKLSAILDGPIKQVSTGNYHTLALHSDNTVYTTGLNTNGELATGSLSPSEYFKFTKNNDITNVHRLESGPTNNCIIRKDGDVHCWGNNAFAAVGTRKTSLSVTTPTSISLD